MKCTDTTADLPLAFGMVKAPVWLPVEQIKSIKSYREAVRLCWIHRRSQGMTKRTLAELADLYAPHVTDYLSELEGKRNLPADKIDAFETICGNRAISQWEAMQRGFSIMEEVISARAAA